MTDLLNRTFDAHCDFVHSQKNRLAFFQPEPNYWLIINLNLGFSIRYTAAATTTTNAMSATSSHDISSSSQPLNHTRKVIEFLGSSVSDAYVSQLLHTAYFLFRLQYGPMSRVHSRSQLHSMWTAFFPRFLEHVDFEHMDYLDAFAGIHYDHSDYATSSSSSTAGARMWLSCEAMWNQLQSTLSLPNHTHPTGDLHFGMLLRHHDTTTTTTHLIWSNMPSATTTRYPYLFFTRYLGLEYTRHQNKVEFRGFLTLPPNLLLRDPSHHQDQQQHGQKHWPRQFIDGQWYRVLVYKYANGLLFCAWVQCQDPTDSTHAKSETGGLDVSKPWTQLGHIKKMDALLRTHLGRLSELIPPSSSTTTPRDKTTTLSPTHLGVLVWNTADLGIQLLGSRELMRRWDVAGVILRLLAHSRHHHQAGGESKEVVMKLSGASISHLVSSPSMASSLVPASTVTGTTTTSTPTPSASPSSSLSTTTTTTAVSDKTWIVFKRVLERDVYVFVYKKDVLSVVDVEEEVKRVRRQVLAGVYV